MRTFDPLKTRAEQGLDTVPSWIFSISEQRAMLAEKGLHEITAVNDRGSWSSVERIKPKVENTEEGTRKDNCLKSVEDDEITMRERKKNEAHIASKLKVVKVYQTRVK
ncbi:MAG TPA: hypothetical protein VEP90_05490 [Methylomirabilota bacterium]|nr:hypothetical protein [Methylomirabilota bacterium]